MKRLVITLLTVVVCAVSANVYFKEEFEGKAPQDFRDGDIELMFRLNFQRVGIVDGLSQSTLMITENLFPLPVK
jgi:hypothetical protein